MVCGFRFSDSPEQLNYVTICHPCREPLCGSVQRFSVLGGNFPMEQAGRLTKGVQRVKNDVSETHTTDDVPPAECWEMWRFSNFSEK